MLDIPELGEKINLLLKHAVNDIHSAAILAKKSEISPDYISRFRSGQRRISSNNLKKLSKAYPEISESLWCESLSVFAQELGLSEAVAKPAFPAMMGIDFESRIKDRNILERRFEIMKGYWEVFRHSISITTHGYIIYQILEIKQLNENGYMECSIYGDRFNYSGYCFLVAGVTYFIMEEFNLFNEMTFIITNSPDRAINPILNGILLCLTGGSYELVAIPSAAKVLLQHRFSLETVKEKYELNGNNMSIHEIINKVQNIINSDTTRLNKILPLIDNHIPQDAVPYVLRAKLF